MAHITKNASNQATHPAPPAATPTFTVAANIDVTSSSPKYAHYINQCMCSTPSATLLGALDHSEELATIPGLTPMLIKIHLPCSTPTDKGHMCHHRSNTDSTQNVQDNVVAACAKVDPMFAPNEIFLMQDAFCFATLADTSTGTMYTNITSAFPVCSWFKSMQYFLLCISMTSLQPLSMTCPCTQMRPW
jgi:hypothetical protein